MEANFRNNAGSDLFQHDAWSGDNLRLNLPAEPSEQYNLRNPSQDILDLASSNTQTHTTPLPVSGSNLLYALMPSSGPMTPFQHENTTTQEMATTDYLEIGAQYLGMDERPFSPAAKLDAKNMIFRTNGGVGYKRPNAHSEFAKVDEYPDLTSVGTCTHTLESFDGGGLGNSCLSRRKRLLIEQRSRVRGWHCPICYQRFKRRDYIKPHVKRKHLEWYNELYRTQSFTPERSLSAPADYYPACGDPSAFGLEVEQRRLPVVAQRPQLSNQITDSFQSGDAFFGGSITPQKSSLDFTPSGGGELPGGLESKSLSRSQSSHDTCARSLACPFYKHFPLQHRKCLALSLRRPKDVKQHIYRSHTTPEFYCARCFHVFHTATERDAHWRDKLCNRLDSSMLLRFQGITEDQKKALTEKSPRDLNVEDQWYQIYAIVFPASELPRSPYVGNWWEEIVPLLREKWETQGYKITARTVGDLGHHQLSFAMDLFFRSLEGEACGHENDGSSICASSGQSHMEDDVQRDTWSLSSV